MTLRINKRWCVAITAVASLATVSGLLMIGVQRVRHAAARTADI
jgi:hypothetical protein